MAADPDPDRGLLPTIHRRRRWLLGLALLTTAVVVVAARGYEAGAGATAFLLFNPPSAAPFGPAGPPSPDLDISTQAALVTNPDVLAAALKDPSVAALPRIRASADPEDLLRRRVRAEVVPGTRLVRVSITLASSRDAATIVNAVARAYHDWAEERGQAGIFEEDKRLRAEGASLQEQIHVKRQEVRERAKGLDPKFAADSFELEFARTDLARLEDMLTKVRTRVAQLQFEASSRRITITPARPGTRPEFDPRTLALALAGVFLAVLFLFYLETFFRRGRPAESPPSGGHGA